MFTRHRFSNNAITINPPRHQTTNLDFSVHRVVFFLQPHFHRNRPSKHARNIIPRITRLQRRKPTLLFRHTRIKHFFTHILKITPRHNNIFMHIIFGTTHLPIQHHSLLWFQRRLLPRHCARIKPTLTKHTHHKLFTFDFMHTFTIYFPLDLIRGRIQIPNRADSYTAFRIICTELITLRTTCHLTEIFTRRCKLSDYPRFIRDPALHQHITILRINRDTKHPVREQFFHFLFTVDHDFPGTQYHPFKTPDWRIHIDLEISRIHIINDIHISSRRPTRRNSHAFNRVLLIKQFGFARPTRFADQPVAFDIFIRTRLRTGKGNRFTMRPNPFYKAPQFTITLFSIIYISVTHAP